MIKFDIEFEFASKLLNAVAGPVFDNVSKQMISAFETRIMEKYGKI
jgi:ribosome-associated toxin RatA of RatAB toxin-antitoxin module